ncbi:arsenate reductase (glutaredoxin) [Phaeovulum sp. NW3]|uniref:arsenate reductase (glutaredoxin) n=1 Tax=Phaeovulum sp. NW3 TaxID=2934933 RepID=UPI0020219D00|nr:arsenate reductase (glutaredoxin) [Phaeovulum sp. NW3]MCL7463455.1 arsenate reductase (glutaredoxin) [Phaeovulum sp. NW3]
MALTIWHNPRCAKSRETLALLTGRGLTPAIRLYLQDPPTLAELRAALAKLGQPAAALMRCKDSPLAPDATEDDILAALVADPRLIERPLVLTDTAAALGRPPEAVLAIL